MKYRDAIINEVGANGPIKAVSLALKVMGVIGPGSFDDMEYSRQLALLIQEGEIMEVEYILPYMDYRVKSMFFPKGTKITHIQS